MAGAQRRSSSTVGVKGSSRKVAKPPLKVLPISVWNPSRLPLQKSRDVGDNHFEAEGDEDSLLTNADLATGAVSFILWDCDLKKVEALCVEEALALSLQRTIFVCLSALFYVLLLC